MTPELKLGALLDDTLVALRNRGRELPDLPKGSVFAEDDATLTSAEVASAAAEAAVDPFQQHGECALLAKMRTASGDVALSGNAAPQATVKSGAQISDRHTKKRLDSAGGSRKDRARADKRGYMPSRSKRGGGGAYGWGAAPSAAELIEWEVGACVRTRIAPVFWYSSAWSQKCSVVRRVARAGRHRLADGRRGRLE